MSSGTVAALGALLLVSLGVVTGAVVAAEPGPVVQQTTPTDPLTPQETSIVIELEPDGDAVWTIRTHYPLDDEMDRRSFEAVAANARDGEYDIGLRVAQRGRTAASAALDRSMSITGVTYNASVPDSPNGTGTLSVQFRWTNFARQENGRLSVGDVFNTSSQWFTDLETGMELTLVPPPNYDPFESDEGRTSGGAYVWQGFHDFDPGEPNAVFDGGDDTGNGNGQAGFPLWIAIGFLILAVLAIVAIAVLWRYGAALPVGSADDEDAGPGEPAAGSTGNGNPGNGAGEAGAATASGAGAEAATASASGDASEEAMEPAIDEELLSDEERVERLLEQNGGRMKQANIVKETGWSNAKVSQLLSGMAEEGRVDKLRIGRENLISFPDEDVTEIED